MSKKTLKKPKCVKQNVKGALVKVKACNICHSRTEFVFACFQQATARYTVNSGTLLKERLHIATGLGSCFVALQLF
jgi:hypothetical protein